MNYITKATSNYRGSQPALGKFFVGISGLCAVLAGWNYFQSISAEQQVEFRKQQLSKPIYKLSQEEMVNPPWNRSNIRQWLYRKVEVSGKPIHRLSCMIPRKVHGVKGFQSVVPLVAKQDQKGREGLIISLGYYPYIYRHIGDRFRIEDTSVQTFVGYVSTLDDLSDHGIFDGNAYQEARKLFTYANLDDIARGSELQNKKQASVAVIQRLYETGDINQRRGKTYSNDCDFAIPYPYYKTESGAIQSGGMPWDYKNNAKCYLASSLISLVLGASIF